ncbi:MAG: DsbA family oxidoreductase, partial [Ginsengibacter sp.]
MNIDIWMDVRCPFCYIEKKNFELALNNFKYKDKVILIWHSFELDPKLKTDIEIDTQEPLPHRNKILKEQAASMQRAITLGKEIGIDFNFGKLIMANSFNAHKLIQFAKSDGVAAEAFESLFKNYFSEGKNIDDLETLLAIGISL